MNTNNKIQQRLLQWLLVTMRLLKHQVNLRNKRLKETIFNNRKAKIVTFVLIWKQCVEKFDLPVAVAPGATVVASILMLQTSPRQPKSHRQPFLPWQRPWPLQRSSGPHCPTTLTIKIENKNKNDKEKFINFFFVGSNLIK